MLTLSHIDDIKTKLSSIDSIDELESHEKQLYELISKHYTLSVGADVSQNKFSIAYLLEKKTDKIDAEILALLLINGKFPTSQTDMENEFIEIRSFSRRSSRYSEQIALAKTRLKDELVCASKGILVVFPKQAVFNKAPMELLKKYPLPIDRLSVRDYIDEIEYYEKKRAVYTQEIDEMTASLNEAQNLLSLTGCGPTLMPVARWLVKFPS